MAVVIKCNNGTVTDTYLEIIGTSLKKGLNEKIIYINNIEKINDYNKNEIFVVANILDAYKLIKKKYKHIIMWFQGVSPEESYMRNHSKLRYVILSIVEKKVLKKSEFCFFVSKTMKKHYEKKYNINFNEDNCYIMPCLNTQINKISFEKEKKYENNYFTYVGSMEVWQKFEKTVLCYKEIEKTKLKNSKLYVYTSEHDEAIKILNKHNVKKYEVNYVENKKLPEVLEQIKYGFIIREDNVVNNVATPTKISTYLSCGIIPIYSDCLKDFAKEAKKMKYAIACDDNMIDKIIEFDKIRIDNKDVYKEYKKIFDNYYNKDKYIENIAEKFKIYFGVKK